MSYTFFWGGPFSQWHSCKFVDENGESYNCAEQFMMAHKARLFGDAWTHALIMKEGNPAKQKSLGRQVKGFDADKWNLHCKAVVYQGNYLKFTQNAELRQKLLDTKDTALVEASPYDKIWGIGLASSDPRAQNKDTWQGTNWLGDILTQLREELLCI